MAGPKGLAQHKGKRKCLATVKKKQQDAARLKEPTLFSYLHRQAIAPPTTTDLTRRAQRNEAEASSRVVVSQMKIPKGLRGTYAARHADQGATSQDRLGDADQSADQDLDSDLDQEPDRACDQDELHAWSSVKVGARVRGHKPGCEPRTRSTTPNDVRHKIQTKDGTPHEAEHVETCQQKPQEGPQVAIAQEGCRKGWILLDRLRSEIGFVYEGLEDNESNELLGYNRVAALEVCADVPRDEVWENVNPGLDRILGFGRPHDEIVAMIRRDREGLQGLYEYFEVLVEQGGVVGGLLEGKVAALMSAMAE